MSVRANLPNPFRQQTVSDLWQAPELDLPAVHQASFESCCLAFANLRAEGQTSSLLLYGEEGNGKSHLLARMLTRFEKANDHTDFTTAQGWTLIAINLANLKSLTWRQLRTALAGELLRATPSGLSQLERLLLCRLTHHGIATGDGSQWLEQLRKDARSITSFTRFLQEFFEAIDPEQRIGHDLRLMLRHLLFGFHQREVDAWLRGAALNPLVLEQLNLQPPASDSAVLEEQAREFVLALCLLATPQLPFVFCFDQIETLMAHGQDAQGLAGFLEIFHALRVNARCALLITSIQSAFRDPLRNALRELEAQQQSELTEVWLAPLTWREAQQLVWLRLDSVLALAELRADRRDRFWPLDEADILTVIGYQARRLFAHCAMLYEQSRPVAPSGTLRSARASGRLGSGKLANHTHFKKLWAARFETILPEMKEDDRFDERILRCLSTLLGFARPSRTVRRDELPRDMDLLVEGHERNVHISLCNHTHLPSYNKRVQRILERFYGYRTYELVLLRDSRREFGPMSRTPRKLREEIIERGAIWVDVTPEMQAALETFHQFFLESAAGNQECRGVCEWAVLTPIPELHPWVEEIFPPSREEGSADLHSGKLKTSSGRLRRASGQPKILSGGLKFPTGGLKSPSGELKFNTNKLKPEDKAKGDSEQSNHSA